MKKIFLALLGFTLLQQAPVALAHEQGNWVVRVGLASVQPDASSDPIDIAGIVTLPEADVGDETQIGITGVYMFRDNWGLELLASTPFTHEIEISEINLDAGETKHLPPTLMLQYYPDIGGENFHPYIGLGINSTIFFDEDIDGDLNLALDGIVGLPPGTVDADLSLKQSWGLSAQIGFDYMINDNWLVNGSIWYTDIDTEAKISTAVADVKFDVEIDPVVYMLSVGYRF